MTQYALWAQEQGGSSQRDFLVPISGASGGTLAAMFAHLVSPAPEEGQVWTIVNGLPAWADASGGGDIGPGTANTLAMFTGATTLGDAPLVYNGSTTLTFAQPAPALMLTDTTASAKSLTIAVDGNKVALRESAGAAGSLLTLDLANNRVGIGDASPTEALVVEGSILLAQSGYFATSGLAGAALHVYGAGADPNSQVFTFKAGQLGIDTLSPSYSLHVGGATPQLAVDTTAASVATGLKVTGAAAGSGIALAAISSGTDEDMTLAGKGAGNVTVLSPLKIGTALVTTIDGSTTPLLSSSNMIGSTGGPTVAAQNGWVKMQDASGAAIWLPVWK